METEREKELWRIAKKRVAFKRHLTLYTLINGSLWLLWYFTDRMNESAGIPWPLFPTLGWGIGIFFNFLGAYVWARPGAIEREYQKLNRK